ncbi:MAG: hypothetical protein LRY51_14330 [Geovibrio sp.]|nr:hypothetical protein [Geovibrio sp.]
MTAKPIKKTPELAEDIRYRYGAKVEVRLIDTSEEPVPPKYGIINPPRCGSRRRQNYKKSKDRILWKIS